MADVFLSYARSSAHVATMAASALRGAGFEVWFDERLPAHRAYSEVIEEQLDSARAVLVLWSADASQSQWVRSEANRARESGRLVQVRLDDARLPMPFDQVQCADLRGWNGGSNPSWNSVLASIAALTGDGSSSRSKPSLAALPPRSNRRQLLIAGGAIAATAAVGNAAWHAFNTPEASPESQVLLQKGLDALQQFDALDAEQPGSATSAIALLTKATEANPDSAIGWGGLALAYAAQRRASPPAERPGLADRVRSAAERAFAIERNEPRALAALRMMDTVHHHWLFAERSRREALRLRPNFPIHTFLLSDVLGNVGRWQEAATLAMKADRTHFLIPGADRKVVVNLWAARRLQEADKALREATDRWPDHPQVWRTRLVYLMYSGRPSDALALLDDEAKRPAAIPGDLVATARTTAMALGGLARAAEAVDANLAYLKNNLARAPQVAQACAAVGAGETALALLRGYYFGDAPWGSLVPPGGDDDRITAPLFLPPMQRLWRTSPFEAMLQRIGLDEYWRQSGTQPDYRRLA